jgi:hypothetical protein
LEAEWIIECEAKQQYMGVCMRWGGTFERMIAVFIEALCPSNVPIVNFHSLLADLVILRLEIESNRRTLVPLAELILCYSDEEGCLSNRGLSSDVHFQYYGSVLHIK